MARLRTLAVLRAAARQKADQENTQFVTDAEANGWLSQSAARWYALQAKGDPQRFYATTDIATTAGTPSYALPSDFAALLGVDRIEAGPRYVRLDPHNFQERRTAPTSPALGQIRYRLQGSLGTIGGGGTERVVFDPDPGTRSFRVHYVRAPAPLTLDVDTVDGVFGWDEWIVYDVAASMARKAEELELANELLRQRDELGGEITTLVTSRDLGTAHQVADVRRRRRYVPRAR